MPNVRLVNHDAGTIHIYVDDKHVGAMDAYENQLYYLEIYPEYRSQGYGKAAMKKFVSRAKRNDHLEVITTTVEHDHMGALLEDLGFHQTDDISQYDMWFFEDAMVETGYRKRL